jgi:hypothetical protein
LSRPTFHPQLVDHQLEAEARFELAGPFRDVLLLRGEDVVTDPGDLDAELLPRCLGMLPNSEFAAARPST